MTGRPASISEEMVEQCVQLFKQGVNPGTDQWYGYSSIEHALMENTQMHTILRNSGVTLDTLWRRMKATQHRLHGKGFNKITIHVRPQLSEEVKEERLKKAEEWSCYTLEELSRVFWIDEKQLFVQNGQYKCYAMEGMKSKIVESSQGLSKGKKLKYIACVNAVLGPVYIAFLSGTSDFTSGFKVRTPVPS